mgnify:CR=1 FL=1
MKRVILTESQLQFLIEAVALDDIYNKYYSDIDWDLFLDIIGSDPTYDRNKPKKMGKYGKWLLNLYKLGNLKVEDLYKAKEYLQYFIKYYNVIDKKDINQYHSLPELYMSLKNLIENDSFTSKSDEIRKIKDGAEKVYEDNDWMIIIPHTQEASCYYGKGTQWCTAAERSHNYFEQYNSQGPLYINIDKNSGAKYQFHFESDSFMDEIDVSISDPINESLGLSDEVLEWYKNNVELWKKLCQESYTIKEDELIFRRYSGEKYWEIYDLEYQQVITNGLIINTSQINDIINQLLKKHFIALENLLGYITIVAYDEDNDWMDSLGHNFTYVNEIENNIGLDISIIETRNINDKYFITVLPSNIDIYKKENYKDVRNVFDVNGNIIGVNKSNGFTDLVDINGDYGIFNIKFPNGKIEYYNDDYQYLLAINEHGENILIDVDTLEETPLS